MEVEGAEPALLRAAVSLSPTNTCDQQNEETTAQEDGLICPQL